MTSWALLADYSYLPVAIILTGSDLPQCATPDLQCCSQDTIVEYEGVVLRALRDGLVDEFGFVVDEYLKELEHVIACKQDY